MQIHPEKLRACRAALHMTQLELATRSGLSVRSIKGWEAAKGASVSRRSLLRLAAALNVEPIELRAGFGDLTSRIDVPRFLLQQIFPHTRHEVLEIVREAAIAEMKGEFQMAASRFELALDKEFDDDLNNKALMIIKYAAALDSAHKSKEALQWLDRLVVDSRWPAVEPSVKCWLKYHVALAYRRIAEQSDAPQRGYLSKAEEELIAVRSRGDARQRVAAVHQLGCVELVRARKARSKGTRSRYLARAGTCFQEAARRWHADDNFREGYSLRRLADIAQIQENALQAHAYLLDALEVFVRFDCYRYRDDVRAQLSELVSSLS